MHSTIPISTTPTHITCTTTLEQAQARSSISNKAHSPTNKAPPLSPAQPTTMCGPGYAPCTQCSAPTPMLHKWGEHQSILCEAARKRFLAGKPEAEHRCATPEPVYTKKNLGDSGAACEECTKKMTSSEVRRPKVGGEESDDEEWVEV